MNRRGKRMVLALSLAAAFSLAGCRLAKEEPAGTEGKLCGAIVTWGEQEIDRRQAEEPILIKPSLFGGVSIEDALFASSEVIAQGERTPEGRVFFDGVEGMEFIYREEMQEDENGTYPLSFTEGSSCFSNVNFHNKDIDGKKEMEVSADCYVSTRLHDTVYISPIYRREDGSYYAKMNHSAGFLFSDNNPGPAWGQTLTESTSWNGDGRDAEESFSVGVNLVLADEVTGLTIREMNAQDKCIREETVGYKEQMDYILQEDTVYILVEEQVLDKNGVPSIHRIVYDRPKEGESICHNSYFGNGKQVLEQMTVTMYTSEP